jgi:hypothetical protein
LWILFRRPRPIYLGARGTHHLGFEIFLPPTAWSSAPLYVYSMYSIYDGILRISSRLFGRDKVSRRAPCQLFQHHIPGGGGIAGYTVCFYMPNHSYIQYIYIYIYKTMPKSVKFRSGQQRSELSDSRDVRFCTTLIHVGI